MSKIIDTFISISNEDLLILKAWGRDESDIKQLCFDASRTAIRKAVEQAHRESFAIQMNEINNRIFKTNTDETSEEEEAV